MDIVLASKQLAHYIERAQHILLVCHQQPDADAVGSIVALSDWLTQLGKPHTKFCRDQAPENLAWLANFEELITSADSILKKQFDTVILVDSGDLKYAGVADLLPQFSPPPFIINIDHHVSNQRFGDCNLVDDTASSTCEMIYRMLTSLGAVISAKTASALLAGIIGDTYGFTNPNAREKSLAAAGGLMNRGASLLQVSNALVKNKTLPHLKLWGRVLERLQYNPKFGMAVTVITDEDLKEFNGDIETTEGISNFLNNLSGVKASLILIQQGTMVKGSFRTNDELIDVSKLATLLGGGGHRKAAGFKITGKISKDTDGHWQIV